MDNHMSANDFFIPWEAFAHGWVSSRDNIEDIINISSSSRDLVWRGVSNASYPLHSSLYRKLLNKFGVPPTEAQMVSAETRILRVARNSWRFDNLSALEIFAQIQHYGGPTRLLDVTYNPLIALWFAVEEKFDEHGSPLPDVDGRLFAFDASRSQLKLDETWGGYDLPWKTGEIEDWSTKLPGLWRPPEYNPRISAQNSGFLLGGVPKVMKGANARYRKGPGDGLSLGTWNINQVRLATSVTLSMNTIDRRPQARSTPTFTLRISAGGKAEIRKVLEQHFGYSSASLYPDMYGLAKYGTSSL